MNFIRMPVIHPLWEMNNSQFLLSSMQNLVLKAQLAEQV